MGTRGERTAWATRTALALSLAAVVAAPGAAGAADAEQDASAWSAVKRRVRPGLTSRLEYAGGWNQGPTQKFELEISPEVEVDLPLGASLTAIGRARGDGWDQLERGRPHQRERSDPSRRALIGDRVEAELREFYVAGDAGPVHYILGKQQVVWGESDGLKVLDVVNPQSFREFILEDFEDSRIPLWTANFEVAWDDWSVQLLWIPDKTYHDFVGPENSGVFRFSAPEFVPVAPPGVEGRVRGAKRPSRFFEDSDAGARIKGFVAGWDVSLNYLYHYYDVPAFFTTVELGPTGPVATVTPRYKRTHLVGATASNAFGDLAVRGELAFSSDRYFTADRGDGVAESEECLYVVGLDWYGFDDTLVSFQLFQSVLTSTNSGLVRDRVDTTLTLFAQHRLWRETLRLELIWLWNVNHGDGLVRPKVVYDWTDHVSTWVGADVFTGSRYGLFGQFDQADRVVVGMQWAI
jgi:hypothetical protein